MKYSYTAKKRIRKNFGKLGDVLTIPNLIELQVLSYNKFLGKKSSGKLDYSNSGLDGVFKSVFPITDYANNCKLEYTGFKLGREEYTEEECRITGKSFSVPLKVDLKLSVNIDPKSSGQLEIFENTEVFLGDMPIMTKFGTFIINGTERVVVSQLHRSPGVFFDHDRGKTHSSGKLLFSARVIPYRGSWLDFEFDQKDIVYARIDRRRKIASTIILRALNYNTKEILDLFYDSNKITVEKGKFFIDQKLNDLKGSIAAFDIVYNKKVIVAKGKRITARHIELAKKSKMKSFQVPSEFLWGKRISEDIIDQSTGEVLLTCNQQITKELVETILESKLKKFDILHTNELDRGPFICNTLDIDPTTDQDTALIEIYRMMRPGEPPTKDAASQLFTNLFQSSDRYDLSAVGRMKFNTRVGRTETEGEGVLSNQDIIDVLKTLINIRNGEDNTDDIDHLGNRRVKCVGEMVENVFRIGLVRVEKAVKERMSTMELAEKLQPKEDRKSVV